MAIAGRVAIVPKGDWSTDATYKRLDAVTYNNTLYFAKKDVPAGTATSNTEYWSKSIVGGASAIATTEDAGVVKPDGKSMSVDESGTLSINLDGTTITLDEAKNVIKLADTLKDKINGAFPAANLINNLTTTEAGFGLDARQGKALDDKITEINGSLMNNLFYGQQVSSIKDVDSVGIYYITNASEMPTGNPFILYSLGILGRSWNYPIFAFDTYSNSQLYIGRMSTSDGVNYAFSEWTQIQT